MLPTNRHRFTIPNSLAAVATVCCLALAWSGLNSDSTADPLADNAVNMLQVETEQPADRQPGQQDGDREQRAEPKHRHQLPDFTFFLFPGRRAR